MSELQLIPSLVRTGCPVPDDLPSGFVKDLPGHAELRLIVNRPKQFAWQDEAMTLEVAGHLWTRARLGGKPSFLRFAARRMRRVNKEKGTNRPALSKEQAEKLWEIACQRRREAVAAFDAFTREMDRLWGEG
jgi:hypothetical protein